MSEYLNGINNFDGTFKLVVDYVKKEDGYGADSNALPFGALAPVTGYGATPRYSPRFGELHYPAMSEGQLA